MKWVKYMSEKIKHVNTGMVKKILYAIAFVCLFTVTLLICIYSPTQHHFDVLGRNNVWFGDNWFYADDNTPVKALNEQYMKVMAVNEEARITKVIDFTPDTDEYLCFRVKSQDVAVYVNGEELYQNSYSKEYRDYAEQMYLLHQISVDGLKKGDVITIHLHSANAKFFNFQFPSIGDRFAIVNYIMKKSGKTLFVCIIAIIIMIMNIVMSCSPLLLEKVHDTNLLNRLTLFLFLSVIYLSTDSGYLEIFVGKTSVISWFNSMSLMLLPIPFILFTKNAFFPGQKRYDVLVILNLVLCTVSILSFAFYARSISTFFIYVHMLIAFDIIAYIVSFVQERTLPEPEVLLGFVSVMITAAGSVASYWKGVVAPASIIFGYGLLAFSICMDIWIIKNRYEINNMRYEMEHMLMEREKNEAERASEEKSRFLSHMSHEIRTPLNAMLGMNELIIHETKDANIRRYAGNIQSAGRTLLALINDVLDFSKIETGKMNIVETNYSLSSVLNDIVIMTQARLGDKKLELRLDVDADMPDILYGDEIRIKQVILNLMTNAVKYTEEGWIQLLVKMRQTSDTSDEEKAVLVVSVSDSGIGIKDEEKEKLFREFERLDQQKNRSIEGTGLGLSITSRLVAFMNGKISVESVYGEGSTFTVEIPQSVVSRVPIGDYRKRFERLSNEKEASHGDSFEDMHFAGKSVFVVDDNAMNLDVIASILEMFDIRVERAGGGREAISRLDSEKFDLIMTDDMMPDIDGKQLMLYLHKNVNSKNHDTPIIVLTANAVAGAREEYTSLGFDSYMTKPIDIDVLQKTLIKYLK